MKRNKFRRTSEDQVSDDKRYGDALVKASADYYERSWRNRIKVQQLDIWIAVGLYLILTGVAFVALI